MENKKVYEILIPVTPNENGFGDTRCDRFGMFSENHNFHFENELINLSGGLSKLTVIDGVWIDDGKTYSEKMIPYRVVCTASEISQIAEFAKKHYEQLAIFVTEIGVATFY